MPYSKPWGLQHSNRGWHNSATYRATPCIQVPTTYRPLEYTVTTVSTTKLGQRVYYN